MSSSSRQDSPLSQLQSTSHSTSNGKEMNRERKRGLSQLEGEIKFGRISADTVNVSAAMRSSYGDNIQGQGCDTGGIPLSLAITVPFVSQVQECPTVENALQFLRTQRINEYRQAVYIDPLAKPSLQAPDDKNLLLLMDKAEEFLAGDGQVMLILGDSGAGKSTFNRHLEYVLWKNYKPGDRIPLLINLPALDRPDRALIVEQLRMLEFSEDQVWELKRHHKLLLICDGYDESQLTTNLHTTNNLNRSGQQDVKLIITCRSQYLGPDYRDRFVPKVTGAYYRLANELFHEVVIAPFSKDQIEKYVEKYVPLEPRTWVAEDYMDRLTSIPNLMDLVKNPFLLTLSLEALPKVVEGKSDLSGLHVTRLQLYDIFANHWLGVNKRRLQEQKLRDVNRQALDALLADGFEQNGIRFQKELAAAIFKEQDGRPFVDYSHMQDRETWKAPFFGLDPERGLLRDSSLLSRAGTQYRFVHRSVLEYFFSCTICDADVGVDVEANVDTDADAIPLSIGNHPLSLRSLVTEPSIIQFLAERVQTHPGFRKHLLALVNLSKTDDKASQAAANAITILVKAGHLFNGADLQGIRIPGADLTGAQFDSTQFQNANLNNVNLTKAWIRQANFSRAHMEGVRFGELPFLQEGDEVMSCAFSPDGRTFAAGLFNGNISVYDTATWTKARTFRGHEYKVVSLAFLPNSQQLVSCCRGRTVRTWDCGNEKTERIKSDHIDAATAWTLSPTGQQAASSGSDGSLKLWDMQTDTVTPTLVRTNVNINCLVYSPNERRVASCGVGGRIQIFDVGTEPSLLSSTIEYRRTISLAFSPDGSRIVAGRESGAMRLYDSTTLVVSSQWMGHSGGVTGVCFSSDGQLIVSCGNDSLVKLWDSATSLLLATFMGHMNPVVSVVFSPDGLKIASSSRDKTVRLWEVNSIALVPQSHDLPQPPTSIAYSPCGRFLISGSRHGEVQQYDSETGEIYIVISTFPGGANCVACSPDGLMVSGGRGGEMTVWNTQTGTSTTCGHMGEVVCVSYSPCGKWIASTGTDLAVWLWDANSRKLIYDIGEVWNVSISIAFSTSELVVASRFPWGKGKMQVWDVETGVCKALWRRQYFTPRCIIYLQKLSQVVFSQDFVIGVWHRRSEENDLAAGGEQTQDEETRDWDEEDEDEDVDDSDEQDSGDGIEVWETQGDDIRYILELVDMIDHFAVSPCRQWVVTVHDSRIRLWDCSSEDEDPRERRCIANIDNFFGDVVGVAWRPSTLEFATACEDGSIRTWRLVENVMAEVSVNMVWGSGFTGFVASGAVLVDAVGLSSTNRKLLEQRGAVFESSFDE